MEALLVGMGRRNNNKIIQTKEQIKCRKNGNSYGIHKDRGWKDLKGANPPQLTNEENNFLKQNKWGIPNERV
ncbi:hypothetical protein [Helicobacter brantae]|uniref:hypothetical protein n=1 Tax=Helicobacter brantae TaxID=375927 RepID=UPI0011C0220E|nr:hypothetical protein [Helicobacter brantae]